jgi:hypothetical protein
MGLEKTVRCPGEHGEHDFEEEFLSPDVNSDMVFFGSSRQSIEEEIP